MISLLNKIIIYIECSSNDAVCLNCADDLLKLSEYDNSFVCGICRLFVIFAKKSLAIPISYKLVKILLEANKTQEIDYQIYLLSRLTGLKNLANYIIQMILLFQPILVENIWDNIVITKTSNKKRRKSKIQSNFGCTTI